jgi:SAM-dependent methyltransferase
MHKGTVIDTINGYEVIDCNNCGFIHINPIPTQEELDKVYKEEYYTTEKPLFIERQLEDIDWWNVVYDDRYDFFEQNLPENRRKILDIGCGPGFFLKRGIERRWKGLGIEPSRQAAEFARGQGLEVLNCFLNDIEPEKKGERFDVIHMSEVLEHIPDPIGLCRTAYDLLDEDGIICVVVPNDYNPFQRVLREKLGFQPYWLAPPHHINYFTFDSLESLLHKVGFKVVHQSAMFPIDIFLLMGNNYIGNDSLGRGCHAKRKQLEINLVRGGLNSLKRELYQFLASKNIGREIVMFAQKKGLTEQRSKRHEKR